MATKVLQILTTTQMCRRQCFFAEQNPQNILDSLIDGGYLCSDPNSTYYVFTIYDLARGITLMRQKWLGELREI